MERITKMTDYILSKFQEKQNDVNSYAFKFSNGRIKKNIYTFPSFNKYSIICFLKIVDHLSLEHW